MLAFAVELNDNKNEHRKPIKRRPFAHLSKINNKTHAFREMRREVDYSDFFHAMQIEISKKETHRWELVPMHLIKANKVLKSI